MTATTAVKCDECDKAYKRPGNLKNHKAIHDSQREIDEAEAFENAKIADLIENDLGTNVPTDKWTVGDLLEESLEPMPIPPSNPATMCAGAATFLREKGSTLPYECMDLLSSQKLVIPVIPSWEETLMQEENELNSFLDEEQVLTPPLSPILTPILAFPPDMDQWICNVCGDVPNNQAEMKDHKQQCPYSNAPIVEELTMPAAVTQRLDTAVKNKQVKEAQGPNLSYWPVGLAEVINSMQITISEQEIKIAALQALIHTPPPATGSSTLCPPRPCSDLSLATRSGASGPLPPPPLRDSPQGDKETEANH